MPLGMSISNCYSFNFYCVIPLYKYFYCHVVNFLIVFLIYFHCFIFLLCYVSCVAMYVLFSCFYSVFLFIICFYCCDPSNLYFFCFYFYCFHIFLIITHPMVHWFQNFQKKQFFFWNNFGWLVGLDMCVNVWWKWFCVLLLW